MNRTDFIRTAIRNQIERHVHVVRKAVTRKSVDLGLRHFSRADLEAVRDRGQMLDIRALYAAPADQSSSTASQFKQRKRSCRSGM